MLLVRLFIKNHKDVRNERVRRQYGLLGGSVGIILNLLLFSLKLAAGLGFGFISVTADAFNNLSDAGASVVALVGFKLADRPADFEHPFGHGRAEYIAGLAIAAIILLMGAELFKSSFEKIINPQPAAFSFLTAAVLLFSILVKFWMFLFNRKIGRVIDSAVMRANAMDSFGDVAATAAVLAGIFLDRWTGLRIDGYIGALVSLFVLYTGYRTARETIGPLLGQTPDPELTQGIRKTVMSHPDILGIHDLIVHSYGPGRTMVSLHAEVSCAMDMLAAHDTIDAIEHELKRRYSCEAVIHMDPIIVDDARINSLRASVERIISSVHPLLSMHDFRMTDGVTRQRIIFDLAVPQQVGMKDEKIIELIGEQIAQMNDSYYAVIHIDRSFF